MTFPHIRITGGPAGHTTQVELDGRQLHGIRKLTVEASVHEVNIVRLEFIATVDVALRARLKAIGVQEIDRPHPAQT